jgi:hypothetical protein
MGTARSLRGAGRSPGQHACAAVRGQAHFLIELIPPQPDVFQLFVAHSLQNPARLPAQPPFFDRSARQDKPNKRLSYAVLMKFHTPPPHLARGFIFADLRVNNTDSKNSFL